MSIHQGSGLRPWRASIGSTVPRRRLGRRLRVLRESAKLKTTEVAKEMDWSQATVSRVEAGQTGIRTLDVERLCLIYGADEQTTASLVALAPGTRTQEWWRVYGDAIPPWFDLYLALEQAASSFLWFECHLVPGILQTTRYGKEIMREEPAHEAEKRLKLRLKRQTILTRAPEPPHYEFLLDESVLRRPVGTPDVMIEQLNRFVEVSQLPNVALRVLPFSAGCHDGLVAGPFVIMDFTKDAPDIAEPTTVYVENFGSAMYLDKPPTVARYIDAFNSLWKKALDEDASRDLVIQVMRDLR